MAKFEDVKAAFLADEATLDLIIQKLIDLQNASAGATPEQLDELLAIADEIGAKEDAVLTPPTEPTP